ncbi:unnamed protein product [Symbiodinium microadriaticum]|nr:unnamed protein product [Symbiodinium microadriaticum]
MLENSSVLSFLSHAFVVLSWSLEMLVELSMLAACLMSLQAFVSAPRGAESPSLRGLATAAGIAAAPGVASAADEYLNYNMTGEFTPFMVIGYFGLTTFLTAFAFGSYLVLTKLILGITCQACIAVLGHDLDMMLRARRVPFTSLSLCLVVATFNTEEDHLNVLFRKSLNLEDFWTFSQQLVPETEFCVAEVVTKVCTCQAFVPAPHAESPSLRGLAAAAGIAAAPGVASAADEYLNYNMTGEFTPFMVIGYFGLTTFLTAFAFGEFTPFMVIGYFGLTTFLTAFAFGSYLVLTKLKII